MSSFYFDKIFDFNIGTHTEKLHNSNYLEKLTGLLANVAPKIRTKTF